MRAYLADEDLYMVAVFQDDPDHFHRNWFFDNIEEAQDYVSWFNDIADLPPLTQEEEQEFLESVGLDFQLDLQ